MSHRQKIEVELLKNVLFDILIINSAEIIEAFNIF